MGLGFLVPAFLAGLAAIAIPLLMHLRDRNEETPTRFPSLMFLVRLPIRTSDRRRVTDWPPLLTVQVPSSSISKVWMVLCFISDAAPRAASRPEVCGLA